MIFHQFGIHTIDMKFNYVNKFCLVLIPSQKLNFGKKIFRYVVFLSENLGLFNYDSVGSSAQSANI